MLQPKQLVAGIGKLIIGIFIAFCVVLILVIATFLLNAFFNGYVAPGSDKKIEQYLEAKYSKDFVVTDIKRGGAGLGSPTHLIAHAHPADDPSLEFKVVGEDNFGDSYVSVLWEAEESPALVGEVKELVANDAMSISVGVNPLPVFKKRLQGAPTLEEAKRQANDREINLNVGLSDSRVSTDQTRREATEIVYRVAKYFDEKEVFSTRVGYSAWGDTEPDSFQYKYTLSVNQDTLDSLASPAGLIDVFRHNEKRRP